MAGGPRRTPGRRGGDRPDPTGNPVDRLRVAIRPEQARTTAWDVAATLAAGTPSVVVRAEALEHGFFELDPCNLDAEEAGIASDRLAAALESALAGGPFISSFTTWRTRQESEIWDV